MINRPSGAQKDTNGSSPLYELARFWDAVVVGAGPAGSVMAHQLALAGSRVLLIDKKTFPRSKPCGCCINSTSLAALRAAGLAELPRRIGGVPLSSLDLRAAGRSPRSAHLPMHGGIALERGRFDTELARAARAAGATFIDGASAKLGTLLDDARQITLQRAGEMVAICARIVIAADGLGGTFLRDEPFFQPCIHLRSRIGAAVTLPADVSDDFDPGVIWMTCGSSGYIGAVRLDDDQLHLAAAFDPAQVRRAGNPGALAAQILKSARRDIPAALNETHWHGTPALSRRRPVEGDRILVIGDAAGYVEPFTGEGIAWALTSALAAAPIALASIRGSETRGQWQRAHASFIGSRQRLCSVLAWILRRPRLTTGAVRLAALAPALSRPLLSTIEHAHPLHSAPYAGATV